jgi:phage terminase large subunit-like protein
MAASNSSVVKDASGNRKPEKAKSTQRIDPLVAALMATGVFMVKPEPVDVGAWIA